MKSCLRSRSLGLIWIAFAVSALLSSELYGDRRDSADAPIEGSAATAAGRDRPCANAEVRDRRIPAKVGDWALVWGPWEAGGWADVLESPDRDANRRAQALLGERVAVLGQRGAWMEVSELGHSWRGWIQAAQLTYGSSRVRRTFATKPTVALATSPYLDIDGCGSRAPFGAQLPVADGSKTHLEVQLPDGRRLDVERSQVALTDQPKSISFALANVDGLLRRPFQTGGNSPTAVDGVGLVYLLLRASGHDGVPREPAALWGRATLVSSGVMEPGDILLLDTFDSQPPSPAILVTDRILLEASPASGVNFLPFDELARSRLREVRRFGGTSSHAGWSLPSLALRAYPANKKDLLLLFILLTSQNAALVALLLAACNRGISNA
ncbi:MAG TPA: NlpC/P60 family protein [Thermoanaerobaculia bacterium]|nr:NlpC/P60 family protein [Thermoanaerobaculia bacterium]